MKYLFSILTLLLVSASSFAQKDEQQIMNKIKALNKAIFEQRDSVVLYGLLHDKLSYGHSGGSVENKSLMIHKAMISPTTYQDFRMENASVLIDGKIAIARHELKAKSFDQQGKEGVLNLHVLQTWVKRKGNWLLLARQAVKLP
jgi:hypothetical protein